MNYLPVPEIKEDLVLEHSIKQYNREDNVCLKKPPKLKPRLHDSIFNRSQSSVSAHAISFRDSCSVNYEINSPMYNKCLRESYFEQCFQVLSKIGEGSFGEVFKVRSKEDGLLYAVKKSKQFFRSENYRQERLEEVRRYEQFSDHENCVTLYKAWEQDDRLYMQMELCQESLDHHLSEKKFLPEAKIWSILLDLLLALKNLHDKNLIHLDIKLDNILIGDEGSCKLADFGLVVDVDKANQFQTTEGDSRYVAPELMQGHFSKAADIFSLGIAILELACNLELPCNGILWQQLRSGILPEKFIKQLSAELRDVIISMMAPEPKLRPTVDELLQNKKLAHILKGRNRWNFLKTIRRVYRRSQRELWTRACAARNILYRLILYLLTGLNIRDANSPTVLNRISALDSSSNFLDDSDLQGSPSGNFSEHSIKFVNSTPLNHHHHSFRSRKDLTKTSFKNDTSSAAIDNNLIYCEHLDGQRTSSFVKSPLDTSSVRGKKLFLKPDESD